MTLAARGRRRRTLSRAHLKVVQELLGHTSNAITADTYSHVALEQQREAAERLSEVFRW